MICHAALARQDSRGAHFREDYPQSGELASSTFTVVQQTHEELSVSNEPVAFTIVRPGETLLPEESGTGMAIT